MREQDQRLALYLGGKGGGGGGGGRLGEVTRLEATHRAKIHAGSMSV